jgi:hypothetical protein
MTGPRTREPRVDLRERRASMIPSIALTGPTH